MKYLKSLIEVDEVWFHFTTFPVGWVVGWFGGGGWLAVLSKNKAKSASKLKLKLSLGELRLSLAKIPSPINYHIRRENY